MLYVTYRKKDGDIPFENRFCVNLNFWWTDIILGKLTQESGNKQPLKLSSFHILTWFLLCRCFEN